MLSLSLAELEKWNWEEIACDLSIRGYAHIRHAIDPGVCAALKNLSANEQVFRRRIDMARYRFGVGEYAYFADPLPEWVAIVRCRLYAALVPLANRMMADLGRPMRYPESFQKFQDQCRSAGQTKPTPLLLHYRAGGFNCLHRDLYGPTVFPLQAMVLLSHKDHDFTGGEFILLEQRPRQQSRATAVTPDCGDLVIFPVSERPVSGRRGPVRATVRHGVSLVHSGERWALGLMFHDAQ